MPFIYTSHRPILSKTAGVSDPVTPLTNTGGTNDGALTTMASVWTSNYSSVDMEALTNNMHEVTTKINELITALSTR